jgi:hypothetical protein
MRQIASARWQTIRQKVRHRFRERLIDSDTYSRDRAQDWQRFHKGKTSSSYLQDIDD